MESVRTAKHTYCLLIFRDFDTTPQNFKNLSINSTNFIHFHPGDRTSREVTRDWEETYQRIYGLGRSILSVLSVLSGNARPFNQSSRYANFDTRSIIYLFIFFVLREMRGRTEMKDIIDVSFILINVRHIFNVTFLIDYSARERSFVYARYLRSVI